MNNKQHQGKYHLLAIFLIPGLLVTTFLSGNWWAPMIFLGISALIVYFVMTKY